MHRLTQSLAGLVVLAALSAGNTGMAATITLSCGAVGIELELCREGAEAWAAQSGHQVKVVSTPNSTTERLALYQQLLAAKASDIDVFQIDVIWPGLLATHLEDLGPHLGDSHGAHFSTIVDNNTVDGRLVAIPWFASVGVLYYRKDLLDKYGESPPATWDELAATAARIQEAERAAENKDLWGYVWQGRAYEGLTCNALEWLASEDAGTVVSRDGKVTVNSPQAVKAIDRAAGWVGSISPRGVLNYAEEEARGVFQSGNAVFMRSWPYAWSLAQQEDSPVRGRVGVAPLPAGTASNGHAAALGGWQLALSRYSRHPAEAADLIRFLTSAPEQKRRAIRASLNPTIPALYEDRDILAAAPFFSELIDIFNGAVARPSTVTGSRYNQVSSAFWNAVHQVLAGNKTAEASLEALERRLKRLSRGGRGW
ncbi:MAG: ABC transporter substrate-binding protein [Pseudomonadota bacterium]